MNTHEIFDKLAKLHQTEITAADGERVVLFTDGPLSQEEIDILRVFTSDELIKLLKATKPGQMQEIKLGEA